MKIKEELPPKIKSLVGNTLLGQDPKIAKLQKRKPEPDTEWEMQLYSDIDNWTGTSTDKLAKQFLKNKDIFDQLALEYPTVMQPPQGKLAYRGTKVKLKSIINAIETKPFKVVKIGKNYFVRFTKFPYSPKRPAQSWTVDPKIATEFGDPSEWQDKVAQVLYSTKVSDKFIFNPKLLALIFGGRSESEVVRLDKKGEFDALISANFLAKKRLLHRLKGLRGYFEKARVLWNTKYAPQIHRKEPHYSMKDLTVTSWSALSKLDGYGNGLGPVARYYKKVVNKALKLLAKR